MVYDNAMVYNNAKVYGSANVLTNAKLFDSAKVYGIAKISVLKEVAAEYPGKTIDNIIVQMEAREKEVGNSAVKTIKFKEK